MIKFLDNKLFRYLSVFLFLNSLILPVKSSSALAAWVLNTNGFLELRTKSNTNLKADVEHGEWIFNKKINGCIRLSDLYKKGSKKITLTFLDKSLIS